MRPTTTFFDFNALLHPGAAFEHPRDVVSHPNLSLAEKRAILARFGFRSSQRQREPLFGTSWPSSRLLPSIRHFGWLGQSKGQKIQMNLVPEFLYRISTTNPLPTTAGSPAGVRMYAAIVEGEIEGPRLRASLAAPGSDWMGNNRTARQISPFPSRRFRSRRKTMESTS
jgi:hypothetical protein